jgi:hypothetical protein
MSFQTPPTHPEYRFDEDKILAEMQEYIDKTYGEHYAKDKFGRPKTQTLEKIIQNGWGLPFCLGNVEKYADRGELKGEFRKDLLKIIHYGMLALHAYDLEHPKVATFTRDIKLIAEGPIGFAGPVGPLVPLNTEGTI